MKVFVKTICYLAASLVVSTLCIFILGFSWGYVEDRSLYLCIQEIGIGVLKFGRKTFLIQTFLSMALLFSALMLTENKRITKQDVLIVSVLAYVASLYSLCKGCGGISSAFQNNNYFVLQLLCFIAYFLLSFAIFIVVRVYYPACIGKTVCLHRVLNEIEQYIMSHVCPLASSLIFGTLSYLWMFTNKLVNYDDIYYLFGKGEEMSSGRWGLYIMEVFFPNVSLPWLWGVISIVLLCVSNCLIIDIFEIKSSLVQCALSCVIISFPSETGTFLFMFTASSYAVAFLCSVLSTVLMKNAVENNNKKQYILSVTLLVLSLSIYQAYIALSTSMLVLILVRDLFIDHNRQNEIRAIILEGCYFIMGIGLALAAYYGVTYFLMRITATEFNGYAEAAIGGSFSIVKRIDMAYMDFFDVLLSKKYGLIRNTVAKVANLLAIVIAFVYALITVLNRRKCWMVTLYLCATIVLVPLSINALILLVEDADLHTLTAYSYVALYIFAAFVVDVWIQNAGIIVANLTVVAMISAVSIGNMFFANKVALRQYMEYENIYSLYQSVIAQVQMTDGYSTDCELAFVGKAPDSTYMAENFGPHYIEGAHGLRNSYSRNEFIRYFLGSNIEFASTKKTKELADNPEVKIMPSFPNYGYIKIVDDNIVVKFS